MLRLGGSSFCHCFWVVTVNSKLAAPSHFSSSQGDTSYHSRSLVSNADLFLGEEASCQCDDQRRLKAEEESSAKVVLLNATQMHPLFTGNGGTCWSGYYVYNDLLCDLKLLISLWGRAHLYILKKCLLHTDWHENCFMDIFIAKHITSFSSSWRHTLRK